MTPNLGHLINEEEHRDAVHIAVAPVQAAQRLHPGQQIGFVSGSTNWVTNETKELIGIVDPFLDGPVYKNEKFWMFLFPNTIDSLRHDWTHPAFLVDELIILEPTPKDHSIYDDDSGSGGSGGCSSC